MIKFISDGLLSMQVTGIGFTTDIPLKRSSLVNCQPSNKLRR
jgi:hypothetical protein